MNSTFIYFFKDKKVFSATLQLHNQLLSVSPVSHIAEP